ncbi:MAG: leucine-rich repeat domain-containing protein, partial [Prevotella sp.]|nr:leucine-rich repeat domain-containing protein [Prevotella sp.]
MKRITFRGLLAALLLFCSVPLWAYDFLAENDDGITLYYTITSEEGAEVKTVEVANNGKSSSGSTDYSGAIVIPSTVEYDGNTYSVTSIGARAFASHWELTSVIIPSGVTSIESQAFYDCEGLTSVEIPGSVISIGDYAFSNCSKLTSVSMSEGVGSIGANAFNNCTTLPSIDIPGSVKSIGASAFVDCYAFTSLVIPEGVESIAADAFASCIGLTSVNIANSVTTIGQEAFAACTNLEEITIGEGVDSIGKFMFNGSKNISVVNYNVKSISSENGGSSPIFYSCAIDTFKIGANVTKMRANTLFQSTVSKIYSFSSEPPALESLAFQSSTIGVVFVPEDAGATYASTDVWNDLTNIIEMTVTIPMTTVEGYVTR